MGCRMRYLPHELLELPRLRVLYLDMGVASPPEEPMHEQCSNILGNLQQLAILSVGSCQLQVGGAGVGGILASSRTMQCSLCVLLLWILLP